MAIPIKTKFRKQQKGKMRGIATSGSKIAFGEYGLQAMAPGLITEKQIEASRIAISRFIKRSGRVWINIFPDKPICKKPAETRMGKGKGNVEYWVAKVKPGRILFEMEGLPEDRAKEALRLASFKLAIPTRFVTRKIF